jgi:hypothetical protein
MYPPSDLGEQDASCTPQRLIEPGDAQPPYDPLSGARAASARPGTTSIARSPSRVAPVIPAPGIARAMPQSHLAEGS